MTERLWADRKDFQEKVGLLSTDRVGSILPGRFSLDATLYGVGLDLANVISMLRESPDEDAVAVVRAFDELPPGAYHLKEWQPRTELSNKDITLDYLIRITDSSAVRIIEALYIEMRKVRGIVAGIIAMQEAEQVIRKTAEYAKTPRGHQDRELLLQIVGVAPVAKNQIQNITVMGGVDARAQQAISFTVPRLEDIVKSLDGVVKSLPKDESDAAP
jgi:hypothetical protein